MPAATPRRISHASRRTRIVAAVVYSATLALLLLPILDFPIAGDDAFWVMTQPAQFGNNAWEAFAADIAATGDFGATQTRFATLTAGIRSATMVTVLHAATYFGVTPSAIWALIKLLHLAALYGAVLWFVYEVTWKTRTGRTRVSPRAFTVIAAVFPLLLVLGAKAQIFNVINGWTYYPLQTYQPAIAAFALAAFVLRADTLMRRNFRVWAAPIGVAFLAVAVALNNSYELFWVAIPATGVAFVAGVIGIGRGRFGWTRAATLITATLFVPFAGYLLWNRAAVAAQPCEVSGGCYAGTELSLDATSLRHVLDNLVGSIPLLGNTGLVEREAYAVRRPVESGVLEWPSIVLMSLAVACVAVILTASRKGTQSSVPAETRGAELPAILVIVATCAAIAVTAADATGLSGRATELMEGWAMPYRVGVIIWSAAALSLAALGAAALSAIRARWVQLVALTVATLAVVAVGSASHTLNAESARLNDANTSLGVISRVHEETALEDTTGIGDSRRCALVSDHLRIRGDGPYPMRTLVGAAGAFEKAFGKPFCSTVPDLGDGNG